MNNTVDYKTALKLRDAGFPQSNDISHSGYYVSDNRETYHYEPYRNTTSDELDSVIAPSVNSVIDWLREEFRIVVEINVDDINDSDKLIEYRVVILDCRGDKPFYPVFIDMERRYTDYHLAQADAVKHILENIKLIHKGIKLC